MFNYLDKNYSKKIILIKGKDALIATGMIIGFNKAFEDRDSFELFKMDVKVPYLDGSIWGKYATNIEIENTWEGTENIIGEVRHKRVELQPWMIERTVTPETDPEYFV